MRRVALPMAMLLGAAGCGGGGGSGGGAPPPPPVNRAPAFTSASAASVPENSTGTIYQATATDPDGNALTFRMEGPDAGRFTINSAGAIGFTASPNFEAPADGDGNNAYQLTVIASDGSLEARLDITITVTNLADQLVVRRTNATGLFITSATGTPRMFHGGGEQIFLYDPATNSSELYLTVTGLTVSNAVAAPDFATSGRLYLYGINASGQAEIRRYGRLPTGVGDPASADIILKGPNVRDFNMRSEGGGLAFGPDNLLYIGIGNNGERGNGAQDLGSFYGKILRIDVSRDDFPGDTERDYAIPAGNSGFTAREIIAYGFDDARRMSFDGPNLYIGEVKVDGGAFAPNEEINLLRPQDIGANYGHPNEPAGAAPNEYDRPGVTPPIISLRLSTSNFPRIVGGVVYRGPIPELSGRYVFSSDNQNFFTVPLTAISQGQTIRNGGVDVSLNPVVPTAGIAGLGLDSNGNLYLSNGYVLLYQ